MAKTLELTNSHERDVHIRFDEGPHLYYIDGKQVRISCTGFIHAFFPHFDADAIVPRLVKKRGGKYFGRTVEDVKAEWAANGAQASALGTAMHLAIELFYNDELDDPKWAAEAAAFRGSKEETLFQAFNAEVVVPSGLKPYRTEWSVYIEEWDLAGQIDGVFVDPKTGHLTLFDWKRSKAVKKTNDWENGYGPVAHLPNANFWHYSLQLNIYKYILQTKYGFTVDAMYLVFLHPNQDNYMSLQVSNFQKEVKDMMEATFDLVRVEEKDYWEFPHKPGDLGGRRVGGGRGRAPTRPTPPSTTASQKATMRLPTGAVRRKRT